MNNQFELLRYSVKVLLLLAFFHILIIASSNYLVQIPFAIPIPFLSTTLLTTWGAFTFPFIFLATDLTVRFYGATLARKIIFLVMLPALLISYLISVLFSDAVWQGWGALNQLNIFVARIALASFCAYVVGQIIDILVFNKLRHKTSWWIAPTVSTIVGNAIDTLIFFSVAFYNSSDAFMADNWLAIAIFDYAVKIIVCLLFFLPIYGTLLSYLLRKMRANLREDNFISGI